MGYDTGLHQVITELERGHPWFEARAELVCDLAGRALVGVDRPLVLDCGCGTGMVASRLAARLPSSLVVGLDWSVASASCREGILLLGGDLLAPPFKGGFDLVLLLDVLEHFEDERPVLARVRSLLAPGGTLLVTVPSIAALWSRFDALSGHFRRYSVRSLREVLVRSGFEAAFSSHFMSFMLPAVLVRRRLFPSPKDISDGDLLRRELRSGRALAPLFSMLARLERKMILAGVRVLPGSSAVAVARAGTGREDSGAGR